MHYDDIAQLAKFYAETPEEKELFDMMTDKGDKYLKAITDRRTGDCINVDIYDVLVAFNITCPAMQHALKKMLAAGKRGHKSYSTDCNEAINSIEQSKLLRKWAK